MRTYHSTRSNEAPLTAKEAIRRGIAPDGGLYVSDALGTVQIPLVDLSEMGYLDLAREVLRALLPDFSPAEIDACVSEAYEKTFASAEVTPVVDISPMGGDGTPASVLELWHGPTSAFKDVALQMLPRLMARTGSDGGAGDEKIMIVTATSGDTGKAALAGFADTPGVGITVFYPEGKVSRVQELQMSTQEGANVAVCGVRGNFDDAQTAVKQIFADRELAERLGAQGVMLSSANSINVGRLVPQVVYYFAAYAQLLRAGTIACGDEVEFCVPTGNFGDILAGYYAKRLGLPVARLIVASDANNVLFDFLTTGTYDRKRPFFTTTSPSMDILVSSVPTGNFGDILAGYYAKRLGLPVARLIVASDANNVLFDFLTTGTYDRKRPFFTTTSPSMDILVSSNLERMLYYLSDGDAGLVSRLMGELAENGSYTLPDELLSKIQEVFACGWADEDEVARAIKACWDENGYLIDPHTACGYHVLSQMPAAPGSKARILLSTANPYKFPRAVAGALGLFCPPDDFACMQVLEKATGTCAPTQLAELQDKPVLHTDVVNIDGMASFVEQAAGGLK